MKDAIQIIKELESLSPYTDQRVAAQTRKEAEDLLRQGVDSPLKEMIQNRLK